MLYLFNVVTGKGEIADPEGSEFSSLEDARAEAKQIARELAAEELRQGRAVSADWRIVVTDEFGTVQATVALGSIVLKPRLRIAYPQPAAEEASASSDSATYLDHYHRAQTLHQEMRAIAANITATFNEVRSRLAQL